MSNPGTQDPNSQQTHDQWIRKVGLIVATDAGNGVDLSEMRIQFKVSQSDFETPNNAAIRVFNLSSDTTQKLKGKEFTRIILQAGYENGAYGIIFQGTIKQARAGRDSQTETYLDFFAADSDEQYNFGMVKQAVDAGTSPKQQVDIIAKAMGATSGTIEFDTALQTNIRGKVLYGMARNQLRDIARSGGSTWSLQDGKVTMIPLKGYQKGEAVVLNSQSGMVGLPQQTEDGVQVRCLLNPKIVIGTQVQIDQASVQRAQVDLALTSVNQNENAFPPVTSDGFYYVMVAEHEGDTRDNDYYTTLTCLTVNKTAPAGNSVKPAG